MLPYFKYKTTCFKNQGRKHTIKESLKSQNVPQLQILIISPHKIAIITKIHYFLFGMQIHCKDIAQICFINLKLFFYD